jgi:hypothetical protein
MSAITREMVRDALRALCDNQPIDEAHKQIVAILAKHVGGSERAEIVSLVRRVKS